MASGDSKSTRAKRTRRRSARPRMAERLRNTGEALDEDLRVRVSYELIRLLSKELYSSPAKAIEELVVNAWDAGARRCDVLVPHLDQKPPKETPRDLLAVFDDGEGMSEAGLRDLWRVGRSRKRSSDTAPERQQIGRFGIGKLATYAIADQVTYISKSRGRILGVGIDFGAFVAADEAEEELPVEVEIFEPDPAALAREELFAGVCRGIDRSPRALCGRSAPHWTMVIVERLKPPATALTHRKLTWVLSTAMPLGSDFELRLNRDVVESVDETSDWLVDFPVHELDDDRLAWLNKKSNDTWRRNKRKKALVSKGFPDGVSGRVRVAAETLYRPSTKRADLGRSHGFFVKVRGRLINQEDPLFGIKPLSYAAFNRLHAVVEADDLDQFLKADREGVEGVGEVDDLERLLSALFNQARQRYEAVVAAVDEESRERRDGLRNYVNPYLVEHPIADVLAARDAANAPARDAASVWSYLDLSAVDGGADRLIRELYDEVGATERRRYTYVYDDLGGTDQLVLFEAESSRFTLNNNHPLVDEYADEPRSKALLEAMVTAEAMLEIYLGETGLDDHVVTQLLARRDALWRSLARERLFSPRALATALRAAQTHPMDLEVAQVAAVRALGFASRHLGGNTGDPDGLAYFHDGRRERLITLEAKSHERGGAPSIAKLGFGSLHDHVEETPGAEGCMLIAPKYPSGASETSAASRQGRRSNVSCWTVEDLARLVEASEHRHISTVEVLDIVVNRHAPPDVHAAVEELLGDRPWSQTELQAAALDEIVASIGTVVDADLSVGEIARLLARRDEFAGVLKEHTLRAVEALSVASRGLMHLSTDKDVIYLRGSADALRARVAAATGEDAVAHRRGTFRD
jgi:hypothetical protein